VWRARHCRFLDSREVRMTSQLRRRCQKPEVRAKRTLSTVYDIAKVSRSTKSSHRKRSAAIFVAVTPNNNEAYILSRTHNYGTYRPTAQTLKRHRSGTAWMQWLYRLCTATFCRAMLCKRGFSRHAVGLSVRPSVRPSRSYILSKRMNISTFFFHRRVAKPFHFSVPNDMAIFRREPPNWGVKCRWGKLKSRFWANIWLHMRPVNTGTGQVLSIRCRRTIVPQV